jgi:hypothetical protein
MVRLSSSRDLCRERLPDEWRDASLPEKSRIRYQF